jgi:long-chain acyl-CoA synthetase
MTSENSSNFWNLAAANKNLRFLDAETRAAFYFSDLPTWHFPTEQPKRLVFLYLENSVKSVALFFQFMKSPHALVLLSPELNTELKQNLEENYQPFFIFDEKRENIVGYSSENYKNAYAELRLFQAIEPPQYALHTELKLLLSTSGSTGSPKLVKLSEQNLLANAQSITQYLPINSEDVAPLNLPIFYSYGLSVLTSNALAGGTIVCTQRDILQKEFWSDFENLGFSTLAGVPYVYEMLQRIGFLKKNYPSLRYLTQAGGKLNAKAVEAFGAWAESQSVKFFVMYGQTEATARMAYLPPQFWLKKSDSIGIPIPNGAFEIDPENQELLYRGANVCAGYAENTTDLAHFEPLSELRTGDLASVDSEGFYYIIGRAKRFAKIFGTRINLDELEEILKTQFRETGFVCINLDDKKLAIFLENGHFDASNVDFQGPIKVFLKEKLDVHPSAVVVKVLEKLPLTANGKPDYKQLGTL